MSRYILLTRSQHSFLKEEERIYLEGYAQA